MNSFKDFLQQSPAVAKLAFALGAIGLIFFFAGAKANLGEGTAEVLASITIIPAIAIAAIQVFKPFGKKEEQENKS